MDKELIIEKLKEFIKTSPNPYIDLEYEPENGIDKNGTNSLRSESWCVGGMAGGNCWGDEADIELGEDEPSKFDQLSNFLKKEFSDITISKHNEIMSSIYPVYFTINEYYGNYKHYEVYDVKFEDLAQIIESVLEVEKKSKRNQIKH